MRKYNHRSLLLLLVFNLCCVACSRTPYPDTSRTILQFGTLIDVTLHDVEPSLANIALDQLEQNFKNYHEDWTPWQDSALTRTNQQLQTGETFIPAAEIMPLLTTCMGLAEQSRDLFNPAIGQLIRLWQMHRHDEADISPPHAEQIAALVRQQPSLSRLSFSGNKLHNSNTAIDLNFGAFAKGYAIDLSMNYLQSLGIEHAVINAGGDLSVRGKTGNRAWRIGIRHPRKDSIIASLEAEDGESIFTSGDYERFYTYEGKRYHHILDPRTGYPATATSSVTVIHDNAGVADAAATALFIAGPAQWHDIARRMGIKYVMLIGSDNTIYMNPAMLQRVKFNDAEEQRIVLSEAL